MNGDLAIGIRSRSRFEVEGEDSKWAEEPKIYISKIWRIGVLLTANKKNKEEGRKHHKNG